MLMRTLIIDDERLARKELIKMLAAYSDLNIVGECANATEAIELIESEQPDLIFLDIQMPGKSGFDLLEDLESVPQVIFVTAYDDYAIKAFEVNAMDYILKPVEEKRLSEALDKVRKRLESTKKAEAEAKPVATASESDRMLSPQDQIFLKDGDKCWFVSLKDVRLFESEGNYVRVYFDRFKPLILKSLNNLEKRLDEREFFRINRKYIVNLAEIEHVETWFNGGLKLRIKDGSELEVSRRQASKFKELMSL